MIIVQLTHFVDDWIYCSFACYVLYFSLSLPIKGLTVGSGIKKKIFRV